MDKPSINLTDLDNFDTDLTEIDKKSRRNILSKYVVEENKEKNKRIKKVKPVSFAISYELDQKIDEYCEKKYMKKSTFAVLALEEFLNKKLSEER